MIVNSMAVRLKLLNTMRIHPTFRVSRLKQVHKSSLVPAAPLPHLVDGGSAYTVLLQSRRQGRGLQYLVKFGKARRERSWVPERFILEPSLITDFEQWHPEPGTEVPAGPGERRRRRLSRFSTRRRPLKGVIAEARSSLPVLLVSSDRGDGLY